MVQTNSARRADGLTDGMRTALRREEHGEIKHVPASTARALVRGNLGEIVAKDTQGLTHRFPRVLFKLNARGLQEVARVRMVDHLTGRTDRRKRARESQLAATAAECGWTVSWPEEQVVIVMVCTRVNPRARHKIERVRVEFDTQGRVKDASWSPASSAAGTRRAPDQDPKGWAHRYLTFGAEVSHP